ncbi:GPP34 family phosphoprotein [Actinoplanes sp. GCM10030250]|uniref:GOLPH3/VPS74 family protein n=1 Tax=Actinoplanes sp. GCM10030250 TaxID=3273376 RepID=UPI003614D8C7
MAVPGSLPQRVFLLALDPDKGRARIGTNLGAMLRAAALAELYVTGHLTDDGGRVVIKIRHSCHDPVLEALLEEIAGSRPRTWQSWVDTRQNAAISAVRLQLSYGGWVRLEPHRVLGLFPVTRVFLRDPGVRKELLARVSAALKTPVGRVDPADAALVAVVAAGNLGLALDRRTRRAEKRRIRDLTHLSGPIAPALHSSIRDAALGGEAA